MYEVVTSFGKITKINGVKSRMVVCDFYKSYIQHNVLEIYKDNSLWSQYALYTTGWHCIEFKTFQIK